MWNQIPLTIGNFIGGFIFTALALHLVNNKEKNETEHAAVNYPTTRKRKGS